MSDMQWQNSWLVPDHMWQFWKLHQLGKMCQSVYHAGCYSKHKRDVYPVLAIKDLDDSLVDNNKMDNDSPEQFEIARNGDHMMIPFQCNTCQFMNIRKHLPIPGNAKDESLMVCLRLVLLDSIWSRERSTIQRSLSLVQSSLVEGELMGHGGEVYPMMGPFSIGDCS